eukprot:10676788-Alexandrium_andersonii.AAC.1
MCIRDRCLAAPRRLEPPGPFWCADFLRLARLRYLHPLPPRGWWLPPMVAAGDEVRDARHATRHANA